MKVSYKIQFSQESLCTPAGIECYKSIKLVVDKCLSPCKGVFSGVDKRTNLKQVEDIIDFKDILYNYKNYKTGYTNDKIFNKEVAGNCGQKTRIVIHIQPFT